MVVFHPQWQGSSKDTLAGNAYLEEYFKEKITHRIVTERHTMQTSKAIHHYPAIHNHALRFSELLRREKPASIFTIGADISTSFIPITYINHLYPRLKILWLSSGLDFDIPKSKNYYFEDILAAQLIGKGDRMLSKYAFSSLTYNQFITFDNIRSLEKETPVYIYLDMVNIESSSLSSLEYLDKNQIIGGSLSDLNTSTETIKAAIDPIKWFYNLLD